MSRQPLRRLPPFPRMNAAAPPMAIVTAGEARTPAARPPEWVEHLPPAGMPPGAFLRAYRAGLLTCFVSREEGIGWHLSISHASRYPTWDEIADARYKFVPDEVTMAMMLPPRGEYVNIHPHCFHLHQVWPRRDGGRPEVGPR